MTTEDYKNIRQCNDGEKLIYICDKCDYNTCKKKYMNQHIKTKKHNCLTMTTQNKTFKTTNTNYMCECGNEYSNRQNLYRHRKKCVLNNKTKLGGVEINELKCQVLELKNIILNMNKNVLFSNSSNNVISHSFNNKNEIKIFLIEQCANALSIQDFVKQLTITLEDINRTRDNNICAITSILERNLKPLSPTTRPIHYVEKDEWYLKDKEEWKEDDGNHFINETYNKFQNECIVESSAMELNEEDYIQIIRSSTKDLQDTERTQIKNTLMTNCKL